MELDKRIIEGKKPLDCFDAEIAKQFIGKKGLFGTHKSQFMNLDTCPKCVFDELKEVDNYDDSPFITSGNHCYRFFLPEEWVQLGEKKFRPFSLNEFLNRYRLGNTVYFRRIGYKEVKCAMFVEYVRGESPEENQIILGNMRYTLAYLFKNCELSLEDIWQPFGVEE